MKKIIVMFTLMLACVFSVAAADVQTYIVERGCEELNLSEGDIVKVAIPNPGSTTTRISVVNGFKSEFVMEPAKGGYSGAGSQVIEAPIPYMENLYLLPVPAIKSQWGRGNIISYW